MNSDQSAKTNYGALTMLTTVFFFWGFIAAGNSVFIPFCRHYFELDQFQGQLIDFAFYLAYYLGALALFTVGSGYGKDIVMSWGYKRSIVYGLLFSALGAAAMIVSVYLDVFVGMLLGLFIIGLGFSLQQTSANPFMIALGNEATGSNRINLGGGINSLGTTIGPIIITLALFGTSAAISDEMIKSLNLSKVIILYSCVGALFLITALMFGLSKRVPAGIRNEKQETAGRALRMLWIMTGLLIICFAPVFSSYRSEEAKKIATLQVELDKIEETEKNAVQTSDANSPLDVNDPSTLNSLESYLKREQNPGSVVQDGEIFNPNPGLRTKDDIITEMEYIRQPLEKKRMLWLSAGLLVVVGGLLFVFARGKKQKQGWGAMQYPQLTLGMLAIFVYVGVEVAVGSNLGELLRQPEFGGFNSSQIAPFISMYWGSLMIGRWAGAINAFQLKDNTKKILRFVVPLIAFGVVLGFSRLLGYEVDILYWYVACVLIQIVAFFVTNDKPALTLGVFGVLGVLATVVGLSSTGLYSIYAFLSAGLFCSIMWPCIFSLALAGLGKYQSQGSAFLVMMILGGAIIPPIQGKLSDVIGIQPSFIVGVLCFAYLAFYALYVRGTLKKQGISFDDQVSAH